MNQLLIRQFKEAILAERPFLSQTLETNGSKSLFDYASAYHTHAENISRERKKEMLDTVYNVTKNTLDEETAINATHELEERYSVSTADHHGPLTHPFFVHSNILAALPSIQNSIMHRKSIVVFACGNVSLNNSSFPRSAIFHGKTSGYEHLNFFPASHRMTPVYGHEGYTIRDIERIQNHIKESRAQEKFDASVEEKLGVILNDIYAREDILSANLFSEQITKSNALLWKNFLPEDKKTPQLIYLELETIVTKLLLNYHINKQTALHQLLFDAETQCNIEKEFDGIPGGFSLKTGKGTFLFWYLPKGAKGRIPLMRGSSELISANTEIRIPLKTDVVAPLLAERRLIPNLMTSLVAISCYYGLRCLGGFNQVNYLPLIQRAWQKIVGGLEPISSPPSVLYSDLMFCMAKQGDKLVPATGLDLALHKTPDTYYAIAQTAKTLTVAESFLLMLPELYRSVYGKKGEPHLLSASHTNMIEALKAQEKIFPCVTIPI